MFCSKKNSNSRVRIVWLALLSSFLSFPFETAQSSGTFKGDDFVGIWQYPDKYMPNRITHYLKITSAGDGQFTLTEGQKDLDNMLKPKETIMWTEPNPYCKNQPNNLTVVKGQLNSQFVADCFRPTHGLDFTYRLTLDLKSSNNMTYTVWSSQDGKRGSSEEFQAIRVGGPTQGQPIQIGLLNDDSTLGCGCYFSPVVPGRNKISDKYLFISDETGKAYLNLNGRDTILQEIGREQARDEYGYCAGRRCTFGANGVTATVDFNETEKCPPEPTECTVSGYDVTITVEKDGMKQTVKGEGACGC